MSKTTIDMTTEEAQDLINDITRALQEYHEVFNSAPEADEIGRWPLWYTSKLQHAEKAVMQAQARLGAYVWIFTTGQHSEMYEEGDKVLRRFTPLVLDEE